ncbi:hypothetical protein V6Z12_A11G332900 [Gossypium hirsutum]
MTNFISTKCRNPPSISANGFLTDHGCKRLYFNQLETLLNSNSTIRGTFTFRIKSIKISIATLIAITTACSTHTHHIYQKKELRPLPFCPLTYVHSPQPPPQLLQPH